MNKTIMLVIASILILGTLVFTQDADAVTVSCPSISSWTAYNQFQGTSNSYTCEYESAPDPIYGTDYASLSVHWHDPVPQYVTTGSGGWCSGDTNGGNHYSSTRFVYVSFDQYYSEFSSAGKTLLRNAESMNLGSSCTSSQDDYSKSAPSPEPLSDDYYELQLEAMELDSAGRYDEAISAYYKLFEIDPTNTTPLHLIADIFIGMKKYEEAIAVLQKANDEIAPGKIKSLEKTISLQKESELKQQKELKEQKLISELEDHIKNGKANLAAGNYDRAILFFNKANDIIPSGEISSLIDQAEQLKKESVAVQTEYNTWINQGSDHLNNGNYDEAIKYFDLAYKQNPNDQNLINLKAEALKKKGISLVEQGKFGLAVVFLGESNHLKYDEFVKASQNNAYNRWHDQIQMERVIFDPNTNDHWKLIEPMEYAPLPTVGKVDADETTRAKIRSVNNDHFTSVTENMPLKMGDVILVGQSPLTLDWGYAQTTLAPGSVFLLGNPEDLRNFARGTPHYIELIEGQIRLYEHVIETAGEDASFLLKVKKNPIEVSGTDVTISYDKTSAASSIQIDDGTVKVFDANTNTVREFGAGNTLVTNNDGNYLEQAAVQLDEYVETPSGGGCLIATAAFGSELAPQIQQLRELRDNTLLHTSSGSAFMTGFNVLYYSFSPTIADWERQNSAFKEAVKLSITPLISSLSILNYVDVDSEAEVIGYGISMILLNIGMYFIAPAILIIKLVKRKRIR